MNKSYRDIFRGTAWYYARYRPGYPKPFFAHVIEEFNLNGTGRLLDLGCGTGQLAIPLANHFEEVVGMDPELEMLAEAKIQADKAGVTNIKWVEGGSEDLKDLKEDLGTFRLVTMGSAFHWMKRDSVLVVLDSIISKNGGIVVVGSASIWNKTNEWKDVMKTVIKKWLGEKRRAGGSVYVAPKERHEIVITRSAFKQMETYRLEYQRSWDMDSLIGHLYSTSFCSIAVLGDKREGFEKDLRETLLKLNPSGKFTEDVAIEAYLARRQ